MYARNTSVSELQEIADSIPVKLDADSTGNYVRFTLKPDGEKFRKQSPQPVGLEWCGGNVYAADFKYRRVNAVCYHGHYEFLARLFERNPDAIVESSRYGKIRYTAANFKTAAEEYGDTPLGPEGNIYSGIRLRDCCTCEVH